MSPTSKEHTDYQVKGRVPDSKSSLHLAGMSLKIEFQDTVSLLYNMNDLIMLGLQSSSIEGGTQAVHRRWNSIVGGTVS